MNLFKVFCQFANPDGSDVVASDFADAAAEFARQFDNRTVCFDFANNNFSNEIITVVAESGMEKKFKVSAIPVVEYKATEVL